MQFCAAAEGWTKGPSDNWLMAEAFSAEKRPFNASCELGGTPYVRERPG
jgi:hypothetical protein